MGKFGTSQPVRRVEDSRFLTGRGSYVGDLHRENIAHAVIVRATVAHGEIAAIDVDDARDAPGVLSVLTGADLDAAMSNDMSADVVKSRDGSPGADPRRPILAVDRVRYVGEPVVAVIAETLEQAKDAAELVEVEYDDLPVVTDTIATLREGAPQLHGEVPGNLAFDWALGDEDANAALFQGAAHTVSLDLINNRVIANPIETRGALAEWGADGRLHIAVNGQGPWSMKREFAKRLQVPAEDVRVTHPDVGGGFGMKGQYYAEYFVCAHAARVTGRPVKWVSDRSEAMLADAMGRDNVTTIEGAFDGGFKLQALRIKTVAALGAYNSPDGQWIPVLAKFVAQGVYEVQSLFMNVKGVYTNTTPVDAYRGAGRPEAIYAIERLMDAAARQFGIGQDEVRRRSWITDFPHKTASGETYDVGDFERVLTRAKAEADWDGFPARKADAAAHGKRRGLGLCYYIESILGSPQETATITFVEDGTVELAVGTASNGQGHETVYAQILHDRTGLPFDKIRVIQADTDRIASGGGTGGSRSVTTQGVAINGASDELIERMRPLAEEELEVASADLIWEDGAFRIAGTDREVGLLQLAGVARAKGLSELLVQQTSTKLPARSFPNGAHIAEVEVDTETGRTTLEKYTVVDDFGVLMNPLLAEGQVHGGVVQGLGQAITEHVAWDEDGQLLTGSFMDYAMPRASDATMIPFHHEGTPSTANPIGMKGCGEAGTVGALAAITNAALDAVWEAGVRHVDMPITPNRMWEWLKAAGR